MSAPVVGIDLGTSNTVVAYADATGAVAVLADESDAKLQPSVVSFHPSGGVIVGAAAKQRRVIDPQNTIYSVKRLIGRAFAAPEVQTAKGRVPYVIEEGANQQPLIGTRAGKFAIPEISAIVLDHARQIASTRLAAAGAKAVARAVVTVPASFNDAQRSATATAGAIAGLEVVRVLNEPTAAALAYGHTRNLRETIAVYDFGGGTFDITILRLADQVYEVLGTAGDSFLGGDDLDERLVDRMVAKFLVEHRIDLRTNEIALMRLRAVAEQTKIELSRRTRAVVRVDEIAYGPNGAPLDLHIEITRAELVTQIADIVDRTFPVCQEALALAGLGVGAIADVVLVGGTTRIPYVRDQVSKFFAKAPRTDVNPEEAVAVGAALQARTFQHAGLGARVAVPAAAGPGLEDLRDEPTSTVREVAAHAPVAGATMAPSELAAPATAKARPRTAAYPLVRREDAKLDTSYTVTRRGVRDVYEDRTPVPVPAPPPAGPATPPAIPLARLTKPIKPPPLPPRATTGRLPAIPAPVPVEVSGTYVADLADTETALEAAPERAASATGASSLDETLVRPDFDDSFSDVDQVRGVPSAPARTLGGAPPAAPSSRVGSDFDDTSGAAAAVDFSADVGEATETGARPLDVSGPAAARTAPGLPPPPVLPPQTFPVMAAAAPAPVILDVTPRGLGIGTIGGFCEALIQRNARVPAATKKLFVTSRDRQDVVRIVVCQGESRRMHDNTVIGDVVLAGLPPRPRGETAIEVTFALDASGILRVRARDAETGHEQSASLDLAGGMAEADVAASRDRVAALRR